MCRQLLGHPWRCGRAFGAESIEQVEAGRFRMSAEDRAVVGTAGADARQVLGDFDRMRGFECGSCGFEELRSFRLGRRGVQVVLIIGRS